MEILEAFDLTGSFRAAASWPAVHITPSSTTSRCATRVACSVGGAQQRPKLIDPHLPKVEEWVERSNGKIRADVVADKLAAVGFAGSERTVRRAVAVKANYRAGGGGCIGRGSRSRGCGRSGTGDRPTRRRSTDEPVLRLAGVVPVRVIIADVGPHAADVDRLSGSGDACFRRCPTYWLTDNERTVTIDHVARVAVRHPLIVEVGHHYGVTITTCVPADPESKGGSEATVRIAKADLVPTEANLLDDYQSGELVAACEAFMEQVNARAASGHRRPPVEMLVEEQLPVAPAARGGVHGGVRGDPQGVVVLNDQLRRGLLLGSPHADRRRGVGACRR